MIFRRNRKNTGKNAGKNKPPLKTADVIKMIFYCLLAGLGGSIFYVFNMGSVWDILSSFGVVVLLAGAATLAGAFTGFLFGVPKSRPVAQFSTEEKKDGTKEEDKQKKSSVNYEANNNFEQISDWLTKILVGVGLTKITSFPKYLASYQEFVANSLPAPGIEIFGNSILIFYSAGGFLISYLWTRRYFGTELETGDMEEIAVKVGQVVDWKEKVIDDHNAEGLVKRQLYEPRGANGVTLEKFVEAFMHASDAQQAAIFYETAEFLRSKSHDDPGKGENNKMDENNKELIKRVVPIFQALIKSDRNKDDYQSHGELGVAYMRIDSSFYDEAKSELDEAINLRNHRHPEESDQFRIYEFHRARCQIMLDGKVNLKPRQKSDSLTAALIKKDIETAESNAEVKKIVDTDTTIKDWLETNRRSDKHDKITFKTE